MSSLLVLFWNKKLLSKCNKGPICKGHKKGSLKLPAFPSYPKTSSCITFFVDLLWCKNAEIIRKEEKKVLWLVCRVGVFFPLKFPWTTWIHKKSTTDMQYSQDKENRYTWAKEESCSFQILCWTKAPSASTQDIFTHSDVHCRLPTLAKLSAEFSVKTLVPAQYTRNFLIFKETFERKIQKKKRNLPPTPA